MKHGYWVDNETVNFATKWKPQIKCMGLENIPTFSDSNGVKFDIEKRKLCTNNKTVRRMHFTVFAMMRTHNALFVRRKKNRQETTRVLGMNCKNGSELDIAYVTETEDKHYSASWQVFGNKNSHLQWKPIEPEKQYVLLEGFLNNKRKRTHRVFSTN